jgi:hypothetical protein
MNACKPSVLAADTGGADLIDVLSVPTVGAAVLSCLSPKAALRQTCSALCALVSMELWLNIALRFGFSRGLLFCCAPQVDQHVEAPNILCRGQEDVVIAGQLARKAVKPKRLTLSCSDTDSSTAMLATEQHHSLFQHVQRLTIIGSLPKDLSQVSTQLAACGRDAVSHCEHCPVQHPCHADVSVPGSLCCQQQTAAQDVFVSMPLLTHLIIDQQLTEQNAQMLAAVRLDSLHRLDVRMDLSHAWFLQGCTQLQALALYTNNLKGASAIAQLTGLTQLELWSKCREQLSVPEQSELGSALAALSDIQSLLISHAPPGPVTEALSQLTGLTELALEKQGLVPNPGPLTLPSCVRLTLYYYISVQHLASIQAPKLQHLTLDICRLALCPSDLDSLRRLCRGVLGACSSLTLDLRTWSTEETVDLMAVLSQDWQPTAEALQPVRCSSAGLQGSSSSSKPCRQWGLKLRFTHCSRQCLELLPKGLHSLCLWWVPCITHPLLCGTPALIRALYLLYLL